MDALVTTEWLAEELGAGDLLVLDATYRSTIPGSPERDPRAEFAAGHIPGARFLDLDTLVDDANPLPAMLPGRDAFAGRMAQLGLREGDRVVLYDAGPHHSSCRAWWVLRMFGVEAALLDGGIAKWRREGRTLEAGASRAKAGSFEPGAALSQVRTRDEMMANVTTSAEQVVDARAAARFTGEEADPRPGCGSGHIPGARNLPYARFFREDGTWKSRDEIAALFREAGVDPARPFVATCGSGITAAVILFAAHLLGHAGALYDGSWSEWGADPSTPKALGPA